MILLLQTYKMQQLQVMDAFLQTSKEGLQVKQRVAGLKYQWEVPERAMCEAVRMKPKLQ
jgi:hypothetical protein